MKEILTDIDRWQQRDEAIALATLVRVRGSAPRLPGARMGLTRGGQMTGSVSGGCVETDVFERALQVLDTGQPVVASYGIADDAGLEVGLSCGGVIDVLIEPFVASVAWQALRNALEHQRPAALAIGLAPAPLLGRKLVAFPNDASIGSIDDAVDQLVVAAGLRLLRDGGTQILTLPFQGDEASVFIEAFPPPPRLFIIGATHTAIPLCRMAHAVGFRVTVVDARAAYAKRERFPEASEVIRAAPDGVLATAALDADAHVVILSHDPKFDIPAMARALRAGVGYVGVMGSRATQARRAAQLREQGFTEADLARVRAPIGLDIGARTPAEIAVAILAEIIAVRSRRDGTALTHHNGAIHARN